jgi:S-adenosylmethionine:tRNA ribosyltransferase-isomerase
MVLDRARAEVGHRAFRDLPALLSPGDLLVVNRSRVFSARLLGQREGGGRAEVLLIRPLGGEVWEALVRPGRRLRAGTRVIVAEDLALRIEPAAPGDDSARRRVRLECVGDPAVVLERRGHTPLPPYIRRPDRPEDRERYQTVYARETGSVAAPTAGLHFTPEVLAALEGRGVECAQVVLHVRPGTFQPVQAAQVEDHRVEPEPYRVPAETAAAVRRTRARAGRVVAVGTTTVRALETAAARQGDVREGEGETDLVILPGFRFQVVDALLTNFHLPRSSLLLLVCALGGRERVLAAYGEAVRAGYRFYSYGDAMLIV